MDWIAITPTTIELTLDGITPVELIQSLLTKIQASSIPGVTSALEEQGEIFRLDGQLYDYSEHRLGIIQSFPPMDFNPNDLIS